MHSDSQQCSDANGSATVTATLLKSSPRSEVYQRDQILRTAEIYSLRPNEMGIDSVLSAMARSLKIENVAVIMFGARENFSTHQLGFQGKSCNEIMRMLSDYLSPISSIISRTKFTADIIVNDLKIGLLVAVPSEKTPVHRMESITTEVASTISALLNDRYLEAISPDTDLHLAQLTFLFLSMIRSPLKKVTSVRSQLAASFDVLHQLFQYFPSSSTSSSSLFPSPVPSNQDMLAYFDLFNQEIDIFRQETRAFHFVVDAALRSLHHHVFSHGEEKVFSVCHHHNSNSDLEKILSDSLENITEPQKLIYTRHTVTLKNFADEEDIALIDDEEIDVEQGEVVQNKGEIDLILLEDEQADITGKRTNFYPRTPGCTPRTLRTYSLDQGNHHSSHNIKSPFRGRKYMCSVDPNNVKTIGNIMVDKGGKTTVLPPLSPVRRTLHLAHSIPALPLLPPPCLKEVEKVTEEEGDEGEQTLSMKSMHTPVSSCSFSQSFTCTPVSRTETLPEPYTKPTHLTTEETISADHSNISNSNLHSILNTHSSSDINLDASAVVVVACEPSASSTSPLSLTLTQPTQSLKNADVVAFHPHHHYHYQHIKNINNINDNNNSHHNVHTCGYNSITDNKEVEDEEEDDDSEESVTVAVSYDWDHVTHQTPQSMAGIAEAIRYTFASLSVLDT